jgi:DNA-binding SARP family transcriptional activator/predicted ATPase
VLVSKFIGGVLPFLTIRVLGSLEIRLQNGDCPVFESVKERALLAYLAVEAGRYHSRETLAGLLWPDRPHASSLANLRHTLAQLRTVLGERNKEQADDLPPLFEISAGTIDLNPAAGLWLDLDEFQERLEAARRYEQDLPSRILELSSAVGLYRGRFMESFSLKGCPEFDYWMLLRRENASLLFLKALRSLALTQEAVDDWAAALSSWRHLLKHEPWDEGAHRKVMALLAAHDQRCAALAQFVHCRQVLRDELGVEPEEATRNLYEQIRQGSYALLSKKTPLWSTARRKTRPAVNPSQAAPNPFVGRRPQLAVLDRALELALGGRGQVMLIVGEAGSGKSRLAQEFTFRALDQHKDLLAACGHCNSITGLEDPYLPFREIVRMLAGLEDCHPPHEMHPEHNRRLEEAFPGVLHSLLGPGADLAGSFIPFEDLEQRLETFGPGIKGWQTEYKPVLDRLSAGLQAGSESKAMHQPNPIDAATRMFADLSRPRPLILLVDDLQWADLGTIGLLHHLIKRLSGSRILLVAAYRQQDLALGRRLLEGGWERHPLLPVLLEIQRELGDVKVDLDQSEGREFVNELVDSQPNYLGKEFRETLFHHTEGNPLFTLELLRAMQSRGDIRQDHSGSWVEGEGLDWETLPARVEAVIAERLGRLLPLEKSLLLVACTEGETFSAEVTADVLGLKPSQVIRLLSGSLGRDHQIVKGLPVGWVHPGKGAAPVLLSRYRFSHHLFHKYLYKDLDPVERSCYHAEVAASLERLYAAAAVEIALPLAWHFEQAGSYIKASEYLLVAGRQAVHLSGLLQAKTLFDRCLGLVRQLPNSSERTHLEIQAQLARNASLFAEEGWGGPQAAKAVTRAIELLEQCAEDSSDLEVFLALIFQANHFTAQNQMPEALAHVDLLLQKVSHSTDPVYQILAYHIAGQVYLFAGQPVQAAEYLQKGLSIYRPEDHPFLTGVTGIDIQQACLTWYSITQWLLGHPGCAAHTSRQAIDLALERSASFSPILTIATAGAFLSVLQKDSEQAGDFGSRCLQLAEQSSHSMGRILGEIVLGWAEVKAGKFESGLARLQKGVEQWQQTGAMNSLPLSMMLLADALSSTGQHEAGLEIVSQVEALIEQSGRRSFESFLYCLHGEILLRQRSLKEPGSMGSQAAAAYFERAMQVARGQQARSLELRAATHLARWLGDQGRSAEGCRLLEPLLRQFDEGVDPPYLREARILLGELTRAG